MNSLSTIIGQYGFPIVAAVGMGYFVYYVWKWVTTQVKPILGETTGTVIGLIDRIRMLDNDLIRLNQKLTVVLQLREQELEELRSKNRKLKRQIGAKCDEEDDI